MLMSADMTPEEVQRFADRKLEIDRSFQLLGRTDQAKVLDLAAKLQWRRLVELRYGRRMTLRFLCRQLSEEEELKILALVRKLGAKQRRPEEADAP